MYQALQGTVPGRWLAARAGWRQASTVENYRRLADHAIGKLAWSRSRTWRPGRCRRPWPSCRHRCRPARCGCLWSAPGLQDRSPTGNSSTGSR